MACSRYGGEGACPKDADAPRSEEGAAVAALLPLLLARHSPTMAGTPEIDFAAVRGLIEAEGVAAPVAAVFAAAIQSGVRAAQSLSAKHGDA